MNTQDTGDFLSLLSSSVKFTDDWILLDLDLDNDFDLLAPIDCYEQSCNNKKFHTYNKSFYESEYVIRAEQVSLGLVVVYLRQIRRQVLQETCVKLLKIPRNPVSYTHLKMPTKA
mgnify:CR=1 FL=1